MGLGFGVQGLPRVPQSKPRSYNSWVEAIKYRVQGVPIG